MHPELNRSVCGTLIPRGPDRANIWDNVVCAHVQEGARRIKSRVSDLKQPYPCTWSALAAQCEILDTSLQPWHPTCTAMLTQKSSLWLINLDSSVGITVLYSADTFQEISGVLGTKRLCQGEKKKKKKHFPASESFFFNKHLCETLQRNKTYFLLIAKLIHLVILMLQASGGRPYFQKFIQFSWFPIQNHCPGACVTYFCFVVFFLLLLFTKCSSISWELSTFHWYLNEDAGLACLRHALGKKKQQRADHF